MAKAVHANPFTALLDLRVLAIALWYVSMPLGPYGISYWLPTLVKDSGGSNTINGWIDVIPRAIVAIALWWVPRVATRVGRPTLFIAGPLLLGAASEKAPGCASSSPFAPVQAGARRSGEVRARGGRSASGPALPRSRRRPM